DPERRRGARRTGERLNRYLARSGVASRRAADELITSGSVLVNGRRPPASGALIDPDADIVTVDGRRVGPPTTHCYVMPSKPLGSCTTLRVLIHEGRHRQVRRMLQAVGQRVAALERSGFGPLRMGRLRRGEWRLLTPREVAALGRATGLER